MYGVYQDITENKRAEQEIKESEQRVRETEQFFRSVLELAPDGLMVVDDAGVVELANAQCEKLFGCPREKLIGQSLASLIPSGDEAWSLTLEGRLSRQIAAPRNGSQPRPVRAAPGWEPVSRRNRLESVARAEWCGREGRHLHPRHHPAQRSGERAETRQGEGRGSHRR